MTNSVVLIKQVPDTNGERNLVDGSWVVDRGSEVLLDEINERAVEAALQIKEKEGDGEVTVLTVGPEQATDAIRKALAMGADKGIHIQDDAIAGSDVVQTAWIIAKALGTIEGVDVVIAGNEATDGRAGALPAILSEYLGLPQLTSVRKLEVDGSSVKAERETDEGLYDLEASLPAIVSVSEKINEPRFPSFKGITAAKKKPIEVLSLSDIEVEAGEVGLDNASSKVTSATPAPPRTAGEKVEDDGNGADKILEFLTSKKII